MTSASRRPTTADDGKVTSQDPAAGEQQPKGSRVTIVVVKAPEQVDVPDIVGADENEAIEQAVWARASRSSAPWST